MHILVTGADGFVGRALCSRLLAHASDRSLDLSQLTAVDQHFSGTPDDPRVRRLAGDFSNPAVLDAALKSPVDIVVHLASVPGAVAERDPLLGERVNLIGTMAMFDRIAGQRGEKVPRVVFASSIAVYGQRYPAMVDRDTRPMPATNYGTHKLMVEIALANQSRRGLLDGLSLRLPGIVARPGVAEGHGSSFMSAVMHAAAQSIEYVCPVSAQATCWWMSLPCCVDKLVHAMTLPGDFLEEDRSCQFPVLGLALSQVIDALARRFGADSVAGISYRPEPRIETLFGRQPSLTVPQAVRLGFVNDGNVDALVERALAAGFVAPRP